MPTKKSPSKKEEPAKEKDPVAGALNQLASAIRQLEKNTNEQFKTLKGLFESKSQYEAPKDGTVTSDIFTEKSEKEQKKVEESVATQPLPKEWRDVIDTTLNPSFGATVEYLDGAKFKLTIIVPKEYSNATPAELETGGGVDRRIKLMPVYLGPDGIREYCELILNNLGDEKRIKINDDRARLLSF